MNKQGALFVNIKLIYLNNIYLYISILNATKLVSDIKNNSYKFINSRKLADCEFKWRDGYGAFSYSQSHICSVFNYTTNQEKRHRLKT